MQDFESPISRRQLLYKSAIGAGLLTVGGGLLAACGGNNSTTAGSSTGGDVSKKQLTLGYIGVACEAPLFAAYHQGFFKDEGLDIKLQQVSGGGLGDAISTGKVAGSTGILYQWLKPVEQGLNVKLATALHKGCLRFIANKDSGIKTLADVKGKTILTDEIGGSAMAFFSVDLAKAGVNPEKDVTWKQVPFDQIPKSLEKGVADVATAPDPATYFPLEDGTAIELASNLDENHKNTNCCAVVLNSSLAEDDPTTAAAIVRAWQKGSTWTGQNISQAASIEIDNNYVAAPKKLLTSLLSAYVWEPESKGLEQEIAEGAVAFKGTGYLDAGTDPQKLAQQAVVQLPGLSS